MPGPMSHGYCTIPAGDGYCAMPPTAIVPSAAHYRPGAAQPLSDLEMVGVTVLLVVAALAVRHRVRRWWWPS